MSTFHGNPRWAFVLAVLAAPGPAHAQEPEPLIEYRVQQGDSCASIARRFFGSARAYDRIHAHNPGLGPPPHRLQAGTVLRLPRQAAGGVGGADARLTVVVNRVEARAPRQRDWREAQRGLGLERGWQVATHDRSSAEITFRDASIVQMREQTLVIIYGASGQLARAGSPRATLERGTLRSRLDELAGVLRVSTASTEADVGSGQTVVSVAEDGTSRLANLEGAAATVTSGSVRVRVPAGTGTLVRRGERPTEPRPLPPAPRWAQDLAGRFVGLTGRGGTLAGSWMPVEGAVAYRVEVARQPDGGDLLAAVEMPATVTRFEVPRIPPGVYYVSVASIDHDLLEGRPSPRRAMQVLSARLIPLGGAEPIEEPYDPGDPSQPFRRPRVLPGTWIVAPVGLRCAAGDVEPAEMLTLREAGVFQVRCLDSRDREVPAFEVEVARVRAVLQPPEAALIRGRPVTIAVRILSPVPLPVMLSPILPDGISVESVERRAEDLYRLRLVAARDAPAEVDVSLGVLAATSSVPLATARIAVNDGVAPTFLRPAPPPEEAPLTPLGLHPIGPMPLSEQLSLGDLDRPGVSVWVSTGALGPVPGSGKVLVRTSTGAQAQIFDQPLRIGFAWILDVDGAGPPAGRRGHGDVTADLAWVVHRSPTLALSIDVGAWIPTRATEAGVEHLLLRPSASLDLQALPWLVLSTRQGLIAGAVGARPLLWSSSWGASVPVTRWLTPGLCVDVAVGRGSVGDLASVSGGADLVLAFGAFELGLLARIPLTADAREGFGSWLVSGSVGLAVSP